MNIAALNVAERKAVDDGGNVYPITRMLDADGDETDDPAEAVVVIVRAGPKAWLVEKIADYSARKHS